VELNSIDRQYVDITVTATLRDGSPAVLNGVDMTLLPPNRRPTAATVWTPASYDGITATVLLAGPEADPVEGALVVPVGGADLWIRVTDTPEVDAAKIERVAIN
jgi:hypothetical protein